MTLISLLDIIYNPSVSLCASWHDSSMSRCRPGWHRACGYFTITRTNIVKALETVEIKTSLATESA